MDAAQEIGELRIDARSQMNFAHLTGDHNPVHVDAAVGRSVELRKCIAHGMNVALSAIERYLAARMRQAAASLPDIARIQLQFPMPVFVDECLSIVCVSADRKRTRLSVRRQQSDLAKITLVWCETVNEAGKHRSAALASQLRVEPPRRDPVRRKIEDGDGVAGKLPLQVGGDRLTHAPPALPSTGSASARWWLLHCCRRSSAWNGRENIRSPILRTAALRIIWRSG